MGVFGGKNPPPRGFSSKWIIRLAIFGFIISIAFQGINCESEPTESQCRPYIEKALKEQQVESEDNTASLNQQQSRDEADTQEENEINETVRDLTRDEGELEESSVIDEEVPSEEQRITLQQTERQDAAERPGEEEHEQEETEQEIKDDEKIVEEEQEEQEQEGEGREKVEAEEEEQEEREETPEEEQEQGEQEEGAEEEKEEEIPEEEETPEEGKTAEEEEETPGEGEEEKTAEGEETTEEEEKREEGEEEEAPEEEGKQEGEEEEETPEEGKLDEGEEAPEEEEKTAEGEETTEEEGKQEEGEEEEAPEEEGKTAEEEIERGEQEETPDEERGEGETPEEEEEKEKAEEKEGTPEEEEEGKEEGEQGETPEEKEEKEEKGEETPEEEKVEEGVEKEAEEEEKEEEKEGKEAEEEQELAPEEDLTKEVIIPENLRPRDHITKILRLDEESVETESAVKKTIDSTLKNLKGLYDSAIKPLEMLYKYRDLSNRHFGDPEIFSKPLIVFMGPWSGGKSSTINYLLDNEFTEMSLRTGAEPSPAYFNILMYGSQEILDGTQLAADWTFSGLQKFGQSLLDRLKGYKLPNRLLEKVNIVEIPGILEIRKQVQRLFPFNDACQWFIDRADIIFLVYDPSKLDVGPETEAILDQLKGREYQTRIILNKADRVKPEELMRVQGTLIWNISPLMSSTEPPVMYTTSLWSMPYENGSPTRLLMAQERAFLRDLREAIDKRVENKIASARRFAVRVRNHAKMVDCYLTTYYNHKTFFGNKKKISDEIIENPQKYHIYEGLSTLTNISRYDLPDPDVYRDFFRLNPLYDFTKLSDTCTYFRGCPINTLDVAIAYDLPELVGKYKKSVEATQKNNS